MGKVIILGSGESGTGAAILAKKLKYDVWVSDYSQISEKYRAILEEYNIPFEEGGHTFDINEIEFVIKSPGVPSGAPIVKKLESFGVKIISEIEFGYLHYTGRVYAVTGSNGKTTTSGLLFHLLRCGGYDAAIGGNYGISFARQVAEDPAEHMVLEVSSFQLDDVETFSPDIAILLNITPDHLDRYDYLLENYAQAKYEIARQQTASDHFIYNGDDSVIAGLVEQHPVVSQQHVIEQTDYIDGISSMEDDSVFDISIEGRHNLFNARCAVEAARIIGVSEESIAIGLASFQNEPHRLEKVDIIDGVQYINDSKATNVDSVYYALDAMKQPTVWMVGGVDKGNDYSTIAALVKEKVKAIVCLGKDNDKIVDFFKDVVPDIYDYDDVDEAVAKSAEIADKGDIVLLSPACASFDLFENYIDRGEKYKAAIRKLR